MYSRMKVLQYHFTFPVFTCRFPLSYDKVMGYDFRGARWVILLCFSLVVSGFSVIIKDHSLFDRRVGAENDMVNFVYK